MKALKQKTAKKEQNPVFFSLRNRYLVYILILIGGLIANTGVLLINSERKALSVTLIVIGVVAVFYSLYIIANDRFHIKGYTSVK